MPTRFVHLPDGLDGLFSAAATAEGGRSRVLRRLVERYLSERGEGAAVEDTAWQARGRGEKITLRLKPDELAALEAVSRESGVRRTTWLTAVVRARLLGRPTLKLDDGHAYMMTHRELNRIGVNLNQIARALNTAVLEGTVLNAEVASVEAARAEIRELVQGLRKAFKGNVDYWAGRE
ncbi:plasmid mobilization relaxosome protein MobC [Brevundimonas vesicularis]|uniref:plasmid mobilization relaxosome protein MobC n=1 Tax=Brevundimonas vesicularis TaxID=41276 RepID=UPI001571AFCC|nr:plasmid mobilization relaxosome protein MobC [Brevundimonas vesicularis]NSX34453.1 plasmid mobilization relaxosome protein MobC [Brevundimonas vesicularis]